MNEALWLTSRLLQLLHRLHCLLMVRWQYSFILANVDKLCGWNRMICFFLYVASVILKLMAINDSLPLKSVSSDDTVACFHFYRVSICATAFFGVVILSVCLSHTCIVRELNDMLIPNERAVTLLLWHQQWLVGDALLPSEICTQSDQKNADFDRFPLITSQP